MDAASLRAEVAKRNAFVEQRLARPLTDGERKDLTDFFHNEEADLLACDSCGLLIRSQNEAPPAQDYSCDRYDPSVIEQQYPDYLAAFRAKEIPFRNLLPADAQVVELGSHYGAFLETARGWGWKAVGVDVGEDAARFARSRGFEVRTGELRDCAFERSSVDALFIWNCFDQIEDPCPVLEEAARILKPDGLLVLRTPNAFFYTLCQTLLKSGPISPEAEEFRVEALAYNNLLGFPYQYGYNRQSLERLTAQFGFRAEGMLNSELLTFPLPERPAWVESEERTIREGVHLLEHSVIEQNGELTGPWIELWFRTPA